MSKLYLIFISVTIVIWGGNPITVEVSSVVLQGYFVVVDFLNISVH